MNLPVVLPPLVNVLIGDVDAVVREFVAQFGLPLVPSARPELVVPSVAVYVTGVAVQPEDVGMRISRSAVSGFVSPGSHREISMVLPAWTASIWAR